MIGKYFDRLCVRDHIPPYFIYIYISFSLFYFRASIRRVLFPYPIYRPRNRVPILCERDGQLLPRLNTKFCRNYGKISGTENCWKIFSEKYFLRISAILVKFSLQLDKQKQQIAISDFRERSIYLSAKNFY